VGQRLHRIVKIRFLELQAVWWVIGLVSPVKWNVYEPSPLHIYVHVQEWLPYWKEPMLFCEGLRSWARTRKMVRLLLRRKATIGADLKMLWQRWDEIKLLMCLPMTDGMELRVGFYVSMNGTHSDLSVVMVVALSGKSASFSVLSCMSVLLTHWWCLII